MYPGDAPSIERHVQMPPPRPKSHGRIRYPPSSHKGLPGQFFCAFLMASASGERVCWAAACPDDLWAAFRDFASDTELLEASSAASTRTRSLRIYPPLTGLIGSGPKRQSSKSDRG